MGGAGGGAKQEPPDPPAAVGGINSIFYEYQQKIARCPPGIAGYGGDSERVRQCFF